MQWPWGRKVLPVTDYGCFHIELPNKILLMRGEILSHLYILLGMGILYILTLIYKLGCVCLSRAIKFKHLPVLSKKFNFCSILDFKYKILDPHVDLTSIIKYCACVKSETRFDYCKSWLCDSEAIWLVSNDESNRWTKYIHKQRCGISFLASYTNFTGALYPGVDHECQYDAWMHLTKGQWIKW